MKRYKICGLNVDIDFKGKLLQRRCSKYHADKSECDCEPDIVIDTDFDYLKQRMAASANKISYDSLEYVVTGAMFYEKLLDFNAFMLHASAVVLDGYAYLFSAPSGTGKSTHTALWEEYFKDRGVYVINDDKPVIMLENGEFYVYGTPWSGKTDKNANRKVKLGGICFLERNDENFIEKIEPKDALPKLVWQTARAKTTDKMTEFMDICNELLKVTTVWRMGCRMDYEAVCMAYEAMSGAIVDPK